MSASTRAGADLSQMLMTVSDIPPRSVLSSDQATELSLLLYTSSVEPTARQPSWTSNTLGPRTSIFC